MLIIGCDYHPGVQQIAFMDTETGEFGERRLEHGEREAEKFYRDLQQTGIRVRVGMEATGHARWFERLLEELHFELWIMCRCLLAWIGSCTARKEPVAIGRIPYCMTFRLAVTIRMPTTSHSAVSDGAIESSLSQPTPIKYSRRLGAI
jgi:hypothetical protein